MTERVDINKAAGCVCKDCIFRRDGDENSRPGIANRNLCALQNPAGTFLTESDLFMSKEDGLGRWRLPDRTKLLTGLTNPQIIQHLLNIELCPDKRHRARHYQPMGGPIDLDMIV